MSFNIPTYIKDAIDRHRLGLATAVNEAVRKAFAKAVDECEDEPGEVDKVLQFFIQGGDEIERRFNAVLRPERTEVRVASIFTHQTPYVTFRTRAARAARCELADLCILASYGVTLDDPLAGIGNALFLQAKEEFDAPPNNYQRQLYEFAHQFSYDRPVVLRTIPPNYRLLPPKDKNALSYWEFTQPLTSLRWSHAPGVQENFGNAIVNFLAGEAGYGFRIPRPNEESWSRIIFDLLTVTAQACANRANLNVHNRKRGAGNMYRELFRALGHGPGTPFVVRNSLSGILSQYGPELERLGREIETGPDYRDKQSTKTRRRKLGKRDGEPPILGNNLEFDGDGNGGTGNFILIQFGRRN